MNTQYSGDTRLEDFINSQNPQAIKLAEAQWKALPDYVGGDRNILPIVDVSGSMYRNGTATPPIFPAVALGLYLAQRNKGQFHNLFMTFSESPEFCLLDDNQSLAEKLFQICKSNWGANTNIQATLEKLFSFARENNISEAQFPKTLVIFSDMQFDQGVAKSKYDTAQEMAYKFSQKYNYQMPNIIYWNLGYRNNLSIQVNSLGVALVSGFSPSIMKSIFKKDTFDPQSIMLEIINDPKYEFELKERSPRRFL